MNEFLRNPIDDQHSNHSQKLWQSLRIIVRYSVYLFIFQMFILYGLYWMAVVSMGINLVLLSHFCLFLSFLGGYCFSVFKSIDQIIDSDAQPWGYLSKATPWEVALRNATIPGSSFPSSHSRKAPPAVEV